MSSPQWLLLCYDCESWHSFGLHRDSFSVNRGLLVEDGWIPCFLCLSKFSITYILFGFSLVVTLHNFSLIRPFWDLLRIYKMNVIYICFRGHRFWFDPWLSISSFVLIYVVFGIPHTDRVIIRFTYSKLRVYSSPLRNSRFVPSFILSSIKEYYRPNNFSIRSQFPIGSFL